ncbi:hypothetical protein ACM26V_19595 [Salipaludibacillus sp. HK11]|uniref:hypothetical protein n=1 Tax=Salipaludibacillus sp. HK11 TaxID=3394320 RepID=UPI0039FC37FD
MKKLKWIQVAFSVLALIFIILGAFLDSSVPLYLAIVFGVFAVIAQTTRHTQAKSISNEGTEHNKDSKEEEDKRKKEEFKSDS